VKAVLVSGRGSSFSAGHDLRAFDQWPQGPDGPVPAFLHALAALRKPLVVALHGSAVGIGATLLLHADWVLAAPRTELRLPFVDLGIAPEAASSLLLAQAVGRLRAKQLLLGGESFSSEQACAWGLVTELVPAPELPAAAMKRANDLARKDAAIVGLIKEWMTPREAIHRRIDEEVEAINGALRKRQAEEQNGHTA